jgi:hypothetical protein
VPLEPGGEPAGKATDLFVRKRLGPKPIVVHQEFAARGGEVFEEIDEGCAVHL